MHREEGETEKHNSDEGKWGELLLNLENQTPKEMFSSKAWISGEGFP